MARSMKKKKKTQMEIKNSINFILRIKIEKLKTHWDVKMKNLGKYISLLEKSGICMYKH